MRYSRRACGTWSPLNDRLDRSFFSRNPVLVAADLIGCQLIRDRLNSSIKVRIVETEAYGDETDLASHASVYRLARGEVMRRTPGVLYIYLSYGIHHCLNVVAHEPGGAGAVLIRAVELVEYGVGAEANAGTGPGRLTRLLQVDLTDDGIDVVASNDVVFRRRNGRIDLRNSKRIGITRDTERPWRFFDSASPHVSPLPRSLRN